MNVRWDPAQEVAQRLKVSQKTIRRWALSGWIESRREGPGRLVYVKVHAGGELDGRPVSINEEMKLEGAQPT